MSLIYRAIWQDDRPDLLDSATEAFTRWARDKHGEELRFDTTLSTIGSVSTSLRTAQVDGTRATESTLIEEAGEDQWTTRQRVITCSDGTQWLWVDVERTTTQVFRRQDIAAPRIVRQLLEHGRSAGGRPRVGQVELHPTVYAVPSDRVATEVIAPLIDPVRTIPIVIFSHDVNLAPSETMRRARTTQEILAGVAHVIVLTPDAQRTFTSQIGQELSVWGGAVRVYLPGSLEPWRHRYYPREIVEKHPRAVGRRIATTLSAAIAAQRPPSAYEIVQAELRGASAASPDELLAVVELELAERDRQIQDLRLEIEARDEWLFDRAIDIEELNSELEAERNKARYWRSLTVGEPDAVVDPTTMPDQASTLTEAAEFCRAYLPLVSLPDGATRDLEELDAAPEATAWAKTAWRGFRALAAYASEAAETNGGFWEWCQHSSHPDTWPATSKKLSMTESESLLNNAAQRAARMLPVDPTVSASGQIEMLAHLKIAEGGGSNIPRVYFYDDTKGSTGRIHVGFFGPHRHMENSRT